MLMKFRNNSTTNAAEKKKKDVTGPGSTHFVAQLEEESEYPELQSCLWNKISFCFKKKKKKKERI